MSSRLPSITARLTLALGLVDVTEVLRLFLSWKNGDDLGAGGASTTSTTESNASRLSSTLLERDVGAGVGVRLCYCSSKVFGQSNSSQNSIVQIRNSQAVALANLFEVCLDDIDDRCTILLHANTSDTVDFQKLRI